MGSIGRSRTGSVLVGVFAVMVLALCQPQTGYAEKSGWPFSVAVDIYSSPLAADINNDDQQEVIVNAGGKVYVFTSTGQVVSGWPYEVAGTLNFSNPAVGDLDPSFSGLEVVACPSSNKIYVFHQDGTPVTGWPISLPGAMRSPVVADLDEDGQPDIISGCTDGKVYAYNHSGVLLSGWPQNTTGDPIYTGVAVADINADGHKEVIACNSNNTVYIWNRTGVLLSGWPIEGLSHLTPAVGDIIPGVTGLEMVFTTPTGIILKYSNGITVPGWDPEKPIVSYGTAAIGSIVYDPDGCLDVVVAASDNNIYAWNASGFVCPGFPASLPGIPSGYYPVPPVLADVDGDGKPEIIIGSSCYAVYGLRSDGTPIQDFPIGNVGMQYSKPVIADLDNNGRLELIFGDVSSVLKVHDFEFPYDYAVAAPYTPSAADQTRGYYVYAKPLFSLVLPDYLPRVPDVPALPISFSATPGEYSPATFSIYALNNLNTVDVSVTNLTSGGNSIAASNIDLRIVKCWDQRRWDDYSKTMFVPELLVKDDTTVLTGYFSSMPITADAVMGSVPANTGKQVWITVKVPSGTASGDYTGTVTVQPANAPSFAVGLKLTVLPFTLSAPIQQYSVYYLGSSFGLPWWPEKTNDPTAWDTLCNAELVDIREHGLQSAGIVAKITGSTAGGPLILDFTNLTKALQFHKDNGLAGFTFWDPGYASIDGRDTFDFRSYYTTEADRQLFYSLLSQVAGQTQDLMHTQFNDVPQLFFYGIDEANRDPNRYPFQNFGPDYAAGICKNMFDAIHLGAGLTVCAEYRDSWGGIDILSPVTNLPIYSYGFVYPGTSVQEIIDETAEDTKQGVWTYWQSWMENPKINRLMAGLILWQGKFTGAAPYAYQANSLNPYDDTDGGYKDCSMAYPSAEGPVPTLQWEAMREGITDVKYLTTLTALIDQEVDPTKKAAAQAVLSGVLNRISLSASDSLFSNSEKDLVDFRSQISGAIINLLANNLPTVSISSPLNNAVIIGNSVTINADATDNDGTINRVEFYQNGNLLNTDTSSPYSYNWPSVTGGSYVLTAKAYDNGGGFITSAAVNITVWNTQDIGNTGATGSASYSSGTYTVIGAGAGIKDNDKTDTFRFVYRQISGDCTITARVASFSSSPNSNARAGVMMRQNTNPNAVEASSLRAPSSNRFYFSRRTSTNGKTASTFTSVSSPYWVRLQRTGNTLKAYRSTNGTSWTQVGSSTTVTMTNPIQIGLVTTSGVKGTLNTATLDNVTITSP